MAIPAAVIAAIIGAASSAAGDIVSDVGGYHVNKALLEKEQAFSAEQALLQRQFEAEQAKLSRDWSERLDSSKYQRMVQDMKAAGVNPAAIGATGAGSTPTASVAHGYAANSPSSHVNSSHYGQLINSAFNAAFTEHMKNDRFSQSMMNQTAYEANRLAKRADKVYENNFRTKKTEPEWLKDYEANFENTVVDL